MELSIVIVSYNVLPFLRQCIQSVITACTSISFEIIIVDNDSQDGSSTYLTNLNNSCINVILNDKNVGYGKGMNQGIQTAKGDFLLFLNPDTIIAQDSIIACIDKLHSDPTCGAVGVRMMDGHGNFLKESKRGYPTALSSFYKAIGLSSVFPKSKTFAHYHQGHLRPECNHRVDILTGAFLMSRKELINEIEGFDERYFMYAEDIDLSHSIIEAGYYNYYIGETSIIHFKGESTRKESLKNTYHFYNSMLLFTRKYNSGNILYISMLSLVLMVIGFTRWIKLNLMPIIRPLIRFVVYGLIFFVISKLWGSLYFENLSYFDYEKHRVLIGVYSGILTLGYYLRNNKFKRLKNLLWASIAILAIYSLLPLNLRSSRAVIVLGAGTILILEFAYQVWISWRERGIFTFWNQKRRAILLGSFEQCSLALTNLQSQQSYQYEGIISEDIIDEVDCLTNFDHLGNYLSEHRIDTMTMHMESMSMNRIMKIISLYGPNYQYLLYSSKTNSIIDSPDSNSQGMVTLVEISWAIDNPINRGAKRAMDIIASLTFIILSPVLIWFIKNKSGWMENIYQSLNGKTSWVGYSNDDYNLDELPTLRPSVIRLHHPPGQGHFENVAYARDYSYMTDIKLIIHSFTDLGNKVEINAKN